MLFSPLQLKQRVCVWYYDLNLSPDSKVIHFLSKSYIQKSKKERKNNHPPSYHPDWPVPLNVQSDNDPDPHIPGYHGALHQPHTHKTATDQAASLQILL